MTIVHSKTGISLTDHFSDSFVDYRLHEILPLSFSQLFVLCSRWTWGTRPRAMGRIADPGHASPSAGFIESKIGNLIEF